MGAEACNVNPTRNTSTDSSISQVHLAEATIKSSAVVERIVGVVNTAVFCGQGGC